MSRTGAPPRVLLLALGLVAASGCVRFYFWAGDHEVAIPPEPASVSTPTPAPDEG